MPSTIQPQPLPVVGVQASDIAVAATVQLNRIGQATRVGAGQSGGVRLITASDLFSSTDTMVEADTTSASVNLSLPGQMEYSRLIGYCRQAAGANPFTLVPKGSDTINGAASLVVTKTVRFYPAPGSTSDWRAIVVEN